MQLPFDPAMLLLEICPTDLPTHLQNCCEVVHRIIVCTIKRLEASQMITNIKIVKPSMLHLFNGILCSFYVKKKKLESSLYY